ncbi:MAG TPA: phage/plasmid primase, P4 family [Candidatus Tumulicola sp.]
MIESQRIVGDTGWDPEKLALEDPERFRQLLESFHLLKGGALGRLPHVAELDAARYFAADCSEHLRYCTAAGGWHIWDGQRWTRDDNGAVVRLAEARVDRIIDSASSEPDLKERQRRLNLAMALRKRRGIENVIALAACENDIAVGKPTAFDADPWLLNAANGTIDLRTGQLRPHFSGDLLTKLVPIAFDTVARCDRWEAFLREIFAGNTATIDYLQRAVGYSLTGANLEQVFFVLHGSGANGKTTFLATLVAITGEYGLNARPETFVGRRDNAATNDLARLRGARFVSSSEIAEGKPLDEAFVKAATGGDIISARFLYGEYFEFEPVFKLWLGTNHKPVIRGVDEGIWRRVRLIPFEQRFDGDRCDPDLRAKLDGELPGILAWAVRGCLAWQERGLRAPETVTKATAAYRTEMDAFGAFLDEQCVVDPKAVASAGDLLSAYRSWAEAAGEKPLTQRWLGLRLEDRGFRKKRNHAGRVVWCGIGLQNEP